MSRTRILTWFVAPLIAIGIALVISSIVLLISDNSPLETFELMWSFGTRRESIASTINRAIPLYFSGLAVAVGFKMGLFNIGVEGQYRLAALFAAWIGAAVSLPALLHVPLIIVVGMAVGAGWAGIIGVLKVQRGVHEVISSIMMNFIAVALIAYLLLNYFQDDDPDSLQIKTEALPSSAGVPTLNSWLEAVGIDLKSGFFVNGFVLIAIVVGVAFYLLVWKSRFGYDLRASGMNPFAALMSGVSPDGMVVRTMLISGGLAGLVGLSTLMGSTHQFDLDFPTGLGFTGIAVALLGRNHPVGIALGALLFGFLNRSAQILDLEGVPKEIVTIMQGIILLAVVIAYEIVGRIARAAEARAARVGLDGGDGGPDAAESPDAGGDGGDGEAVGADPEGVPV